MVRGALILGRVEHLTLVHFLGHASYTRFGIDVDRAESRIVTRLLLLLLRQYVSVKLRRAVHSLG